MAELGIQKKQRKIWPWIVGLLLIALLVWAALRISGARITDGDTVSVLTQHEGRADATAAR